MQERGICLPAEVKGVEADHVSAEHGLKQFRGGGYRLEDLHPDGKDGQQCEGGKGSMEHRGVVGV